MTEGTDLLSGDEQHRVAIAGAIAGNRPLRLAEEPTGNLDLTSGKEGWPLSKDLWHDAARPLSFLMVSRDPDRASNPDRMLFQSDGNTETADLRFAWGVDDPRGGDDD